MNIFGVDFTSAPRRSKPITTASCVFNSGVLKVVRFTDLVDFDSFDNLLNKLGPWVAGFDFPFGQSRKLVTNIGWSMAWEGYVSDVAKMTKDQLKKTGRLVIKSIGGLLIFVRGLLALKSCMVFQLARCSMKALHVY